MAGDASELLTQLEFCEQDAASIDADPRLPKIRETMTDPAWQFWMDRALDTKRREKLFLGVRTAIAEGDYDRAESLLQTFRNQRAGLADLAAEWDRNAPRRNALKSLEVKKAQQEAGGSPPDIWQALADHVHAEAKRRGKKLNRAQKFRLIPETTAGDDLILTVGQERLQISRDGELIVCTSDKTGKDKEAKYLKYSSFERYLKRPTAKKTAPR